ncbi:hypothetical protein MJH12_11575, partial [bacterium]|nr:hypothetical protein [bacterium]
LESMMIGMLYVKKNERILNNVRAFAEKRAQDMIKRKEVAKQSLRRIYFVDRLESIQFYQDSKSFWWFKNETKLKGDTFNDEAHARYDIMDIYGKRAIYDVVSKNRLVMVGKVAKSSGLDVQIISSDSTFNFQGNELRSLKGSNFRILSNGTVMTKRDDDKDKWMIRALVGNTDLAFRDKKGSFHYNPDRKAYVKQDESYIVTPEELETEETNNTPELVNHSIAPESNPSRRCQVLTIKCANLIAPEQPVSFTNFDPLDIMSRDAFQSSSPQGETNSSLEAVSSEQNFSTDEVEGPNQSTSE